MDFVVAAWELVTAFLAVAIYGTEGRPRHPIWRSIVRIIAFGGAGVAFTHLTGWVDVPFPGWPVIVLWCTCGLIVLMAEYEVGWPPLSLLAGMVMVGLIVLAIFVEREAAERPFDPATMLDQSAVSPIR